MIESFYFDLAKSESTVTSIYSSLNNEPMPVKADDGNSYDVIPWGAQNQLPYELREMVEKNSVLSQDKFFNLLTCYGRGLEYIDIAKLAHATGHTKEDVLSDIKALIDKKVFSQAWLDEQETTLMLTKEIYKQYQDIRTQSEMLRQQAEAEQASDSDLPAGAREIIKEGQQYIQTIHDFNDEIPGEEMSEKLYRLESTMDRIVEQVRKQPESAAELRKLMSYYLPTTVKLLNAYKELDKQTVKGDNIVKTKKEIEEALDTINDAFEKLLDSLFQSMAWDVSSDISVMQTMFAQDGLTEREMAAQEGQTTAEMEKQVYGTTLTWGDEGGAAQAQMQEEQR